MPWAFKEETLTNSTRELTIRKRQLEFLGDMTRKENLKNLELADHTEDG